MESLRNGRNTDFANSTSSRTPLLAISAVNLMKPGMTLEACIFTASAITFPKGQ
jgi:hypothetical protein